MFSEDDDGVGVGEEPVLASDFWRPEDGDWAPTADPGLECARRQASLDELTDESEVVRVVAQVPSRDLGVVEEPWLPVTLDVHDRGWPDSLRPFMAEGSRTVSPSALRALRRR